MTSKRALLSQERESPGLGRLDLLLAGLVLLSAFTAESGATGGSPIALPAPDPVLLEADAHYARRHEGRVGARANNDPISKAISGYEKGAEAAESAEARWKLARALYFKGSYTGLDAASRRAIFDKGRQVGEEALAILERRAQAKGTGSFRDLSPRQLASLLRDDPDAAPTFFWTAVAWGEWARLVGKLKAARMGVATKIRDYAASVIVLDPAFEQGGGYRILGRLHHLAPRVPLLTGWVSRKEALRNLREAVKVAPRNFVNRHFLAEALAEGDASERAQAVRIEKGILADLPPPSHLVEALQIQEEASRNLLAWARARKRAG